MIQAKETRSGWKQALQLGTEVSRLILAGSPRSQGSLLFWLKVEKVRIPPARVPGGGSDTADEILWCPLELLPSAPKGNSLCSLGVDGKGALERQTA